MEEPVPPNDDVFSSGIECESAFSAESGESCQIDIPDLSAKSGLRTADLPRELSPRRPGPVLIYTDALGAGHCAAAAVPPGGAPERVTHVQVPQWVSGLPGTECRFVEFELIEAASVATSA